MATNGEVKAADDGPPKVDAADAGAAEVVKEDGHTEQVDFKKLTTQEAFQVLGVTEKGLTSEQHKQRLAEYGPNKLPEGTRNPILVYLGYMWNPLSWAMEVAALLAIILLDFPDFGLILGLLIMNATISYREEASADKAIKALAAALAPKARAIRDGKLEQVDAAELVPGDIVLIAIGNIIPADIKLLGEEGDDVPMQIDQAALTGESLPAKKFAGDVCFSGSTVKQGEKHAVVYATGLNTFFGRAASLIAGTHNVANLQKIMTRIGGVCLITIGIWCVIELGVQFGHYNHSCYLGIERCPTLTNMLVIIVGGIPIAMPTVLSVTLALGAYKLAREGAIVARMSAVEEMAGMDILCSDKTGTLTLNQLSVDKATVLVTVPNMPVEEALKLGALSANISSQEPIDVVMHESCEDHETLWDSYKQVKFVPFNPTDKYTIASVVPNDGSPPFRLMKGAPQVVLRNSANKEAIRTEVEEKIVDFANRGYRALGLSRAMGLEGEPSFEFVCLLPLFDPPRHDTKETIDRCREKGISVKMVTGDQLLIGKETARQLGLGTDMYSTEVLLSHKESKSEAELGEAVEKADGFAEVFPEHKYEIVAILQRRNHMVGMTGDGVNDAPALKKADVGVAVDGATDAARGAADIVLTEPGLSVIITAIIGARKIFQRMTTYSKYTVAMTFRIAFTFGLLTTIYNFYFPTILIVLLAVFNDGAMIALSKDKVTASNLPNSWQLKNIFIAGIVYGLYLTLSSWVLFYVATHTSFFRDKIRMHDLRFAPVSYLEEFCLNTEIPRKTPVRSLRNGKCAFVCCRHCHAVNVDKVSRLYVRPSLSCVDAVPHKPNRAGLGPGSASVCSILLTEDHYDRPGPVCCGAALRSRRHDPHAAVLPGFFLWPGCSFRGSHHQVVANGCGGPLDLHRLLRSTAGSNHHRFLWL
jgi:H+-transporting ATPase